MGKWQTHSRHHKREPRGQPFPSRPIPFSELWTLTGSEFWEKTEPNLGSAGLEFRERTGRSPGLAGSEFGERTVQNLGSAVFGVRRKDQAEHRFCRFGVRTNPYHNPNLNPNLGFFSELRTCCTKVRSIPFSKLRTFLWTQTLNQNSESGFGQVLSLFLKKRKKEK